MDYIEWAEQYETNAARIREVINRKKDLRRMRLTADQKKQLNAEIAEYQHVCREMLSIAHTLRERGKNEK